MVCMGLTLEFQKTLVYKNIQIFFEESSLELLFEHHERRLFHSN